MLFTAKLNRATACYNGPEHNLAIVILQILFQFYASQWGIVNLCKIQFKNDRKKTTYFLFSYQTKQPDLGRLSPQKQWDERQTLLLLMHGIWESWKMSLSMIDMMRESMQKPCCQAIIHPNWSRFKLPGGIDYMCRPRKHGKHWAITIKQRDRCFLPLLEILHCVAQCFI